MIDIDVIQANNSSHQEIDELMVDLQERRISNEIRDTLIFVEHPEIVTVGRRGMLDNLEVPDGFSSSQVDRGGGLTWHGPGQLVGYPIFQWSEESVRSVITTIEEWIIQSLSLFGVSGLRDKSMQGVWFNNHKVASIGLAFSKWVSRHGFDINLDTPDGKGPNENSTNTFRKLSAAPTLFKGQVYFPIYEPPQGANPCNIGNAFI